MNKIQWFSLFPGIWGSDVLNGYSYTLFLSKQHATIDQGLDVLNFLRGIDAKTRKNIRKTTKHIKKEHRGKHLKKPFKQGPYSVFDMFL